MGNPLSNDGMSKVIGRIRAAGVTVIEKPYWRTNNRNHKGAWGPVNGVMVHHTASLSDSSAYADWIFTEGRSDVPGPLCHFFIGRSGQVYIGSNGRANHAGKGMSWVRDRVRAGLTADTPEMSPGGSGDVDFNQSFYGIECAGTGGRPDFTDAEYHAMTVTVGELLRALGFGPDVIGHSEATTSKPNDPNYDMRQIRRDVAQYMAGSKPAEPKQEDDMAISDKLRRPDGHVATLGDMIAWMDWRIERIEKAVLGDGLTRARVGGSTDLATEASWAAENVAAVLDAIRTVPGIDQAAIDKIADGVAERLNPEQPGTES